MKIGFYLFFLSMAFFLGLFNVSAYEVVPYAGIDGQINKLKFKEGYGENLFPKHYPQVNLYAGLKFNGSYSFEFGYIEAGLKSKYSTLYAGDNIIGAVLTKPLSPAVFNNYLKIKGSHIGIVNRFAQDDWDHFRVLGGVGLAFLKAEAIRETIEVGIPPYTLNRKRYFSKHKVVLRFIAASEYKFKNNLGIRASVLFLNTSKMTMRAQPISGTFTPAIRPKDSFVYSLGGFYEF